ncbi:hypothetical protein C6A85_39890, partial [Mycobacterium sp. ITM-2017-0098]
MGTGAAGYVAEMPRADVGLLTPAALAIRATAAAVVGHIGDPTTANSAIFGADLTIDADASVPGGVPLLQPGATHRAVVQVGPDRP